MTKKTKTPQILQGFCSLRAGLCKGSKGSLSWKRLKSRCRNHKGGISKTHPWYPGDRKVLCSRGCGTKTVHMNTETLISGVWLQLHQDNSWAVPTSPSQSLHLAASCLAPQQPLRHVQEAPMPTADTTASSLSPLPCHKAQVQIPSVAGAPASTGGTFSQRVHSPKQLPHPPVCSLNCSNSTNPLKDLNHPGHCSLQVFKTSLFLLGLGKIISCG